MSSEVSMEMHVMRLEDQLNRMNLVITGQRQRIAAGRSAQPHEPGYHRAETEN